MWNIPDEIIHDPNHKVPMDEINEKVRGIMARKSKDAVMTEATKLWSRNMSPLGLDARTLTSVGNKKIHHLRLAEAQASPIYKVFQKHSVTRRYGVNAKKYVKKYGQHEVAALAHNLGVHDRDVKKYSRTAQNYINRISSNLLE